MEKIKKENKEKILEKIRKASSEEYETSWDEKGIPTSKKKINVQRGKKAKEKGSRFELKVRKDLELKGKIVDKWGNNVDLNNNKITIAKKIFNPYKKIMIPSSGFPDFIVFREAYPNSGLYSLIGVEVKMNGFLSKEEKEKCVWYLKNRIFSQIWIARKGEKRGKIIYDDFAEKYKKYLNEK